MSFSPLRRIFDAQMPGIQIIKFSLLLKNSSAFYIRQPIKTEAEEAEKPNEFENPSQNFRYTFIKTKDTKDVSFKITISLLQGFNSTHLSITAH